MKSLMGVDNASQLISVKHKKKISAMEKYGVDNVSKSTIIKSQLSTIRYEYWKNKRRTTEQELTRTTYRRDVARYTDRSYKAFKHIIDPTNSRSKNWHIDHKFSISEGYKNNIDPAIIGHVSNLRMLDRHTNCVIKNSKCSITLIELLTAFANSN
jgi:hypothetical protein